MASVQKQRIRPFLDNADAIWRRASYQLAMDKAAAREKLLRNGWLSMMPPEFSAALLDICVWKSFSENAPLYLAGDPPGGIYGIVEGTISITLGLGRADSPPVNFGKAVVWTGLGPLLSGQPRRATIMCTERVFAAYAPLPRLRALLSAQPGWWMHMAQELLIEFDLAASIANDLLIRSARRRCAAMLLRLGDCRFAPPQGGTIAEAHVTQEALAELCNLSRSSISLILKTMLDGGQISASYRTVRLLDYEALRLIADSDL